MMKILLRHRTTIQATALLIASYLIITNMTGIATANDPVCTADNKKCIFDVLKKSAEQIDNVAWRDQSYREYARGIALEGDYDEAINSIALIISNDTKAMTIRAIAMTLKEQDYMPEQRRAVYQKLEEIADKIPHEPSNAIAYTYIAMGQAFAGDDELAWQTAREMSNQALRNKAFGETAEIQAERDDLPAALKSIEQIDTVSYRNKAYSITAKIFTQKGSLDNALKLAAQIENPYKKAQALQEILDYNPELYERSHTKKDILP